MMGGIVGGANTRVIWQDHRATSTNQATFTATSVPFGDESPRRWIIVAFRCGNLTGNLTAPTSCTIGGVAATKIFEDPVGIALTHRQVWIAHVPTGASGTITVNRAANMTGQVLNVWAAYDLQSAVEVDAKVSSAANPASVSLTVSAGGIAIAFTDGTSAGPFTWTEPTEDVDSALGTLSYSAASKSKLAAGSLAVSVSGAANHTVVAASFR